MAVDRSLDQVFWEKSLQCLEVEKGKPSLTTVQGLLLMFLHEEGQGRDAIALQYRCLAHDMYERLKLDRRRPDPGELVRNPTAAKRWKAVTVAMWGIFAVDTYVSHSNSSGVGLSSCETSY